jgi:flagellar biosynthetic protein FliR
MQVQVEYIVNFLLILLRTSIVFALLPFFGSKILPMNFKIGLVVSVSIILAFIVEVKFSVNDISLLITTEIIFGIVLGLVARMVFLATEMAGQLMSNMIGMSIATFYDPEVGQSNELSRLLGIIAIITFFTLDIHHEVIFLFVKSYEILPAGRVNIEALLSRLLYAVGYLSILSLRVAAPVVIMMMLTNIVMGFISRAVPQMNIFFVGYPVYFFIGFLTLIISIPAYVYLFGSSYDTMKNELMRILTVAGT